MTWSGFTASSRSFAGTPSAIAPLGTSMPLGTTAPAPTSAPVRTSARCNTIDPVPIERAVLHRATFEVREVTDRAVGAHDRLELPGAVEHRAVLDRRAGADHDAALVAAQHRLRPHRDPGPITTLPMIVHSGCTKASGSICGTMSPRAYSAMARKVACPAVDDAAVAQHVRAVAEQGYTIVEDAIEPELVDALRRDLEQLEQFFEVEPAANSFEGYHTLRLYNLLAFGRLFELIPVHPHVLPIVERVLDPGCLISSLSSISIQPGETAQPIHADDQLIPIPKPHPPTVCNSMWALTDFTEANGATRGSCPARICPTTPPTTAPTTTRSRRRCRAGSVLIWHGSLWHGGGANTTDETRMGIAMNYCAGYIRQQENQQLGLPRETVDGFSPRLRELVGYGVYNMLIGHINKQSPEHLLLDQPTATQRRRRRRPEPDGVGPNLNVLRIDDNDGVRLLTLDRPDALNAFNTPLYDACAAAFHEASARDDIACVVLTGTGRAFSAGQDLGEMSRIDPSRARPHGRRSRARASRASSTPSPRSRSRCSPRSTGSASASA